MDINYMFLPFLNRYKHKFMYNYTVIICYIIIAEW